MAVREILPIDDPLLRKKAKKVHRFDPALQRLVADMFETLHAADGAGLAGPQVGQLLRVFVAQDEGTEYAIVNPEIVRAEGAERGAEACLSLPGYYGDNIRRAAKVVVKGHDARGKPLRITADGWFARVLQHEIDHLDGILFLDHLERPGDLRALRRSDRAVQESTAERGEVVSRRR